MALKKTPNPLYYNLEGHFWSLLDHSGGFLITLNLNATSRAVLLATLTADSALSAVERLAIQRLINGNLETAPSGEFQADRLLVTQKSVAALLSVSRVTVWRMTKNRILNPIEMLPGMWRYHYAEIAALARIGEHSVLSRYDG